MRGGGGHGRCRDVNRVLVVDDDQSLVRALSVSLSSRGYDVAVVGTGEDALGWAAQHDPDLILLDLGLPGIDGIDVIRRLRGWSQVLVIVLSARHQETAKVEALDAGADDYVTKPFAMAELLARIRAALRRQVGTEVSPRVETADFVIDLAVMRVTRGGQVVRLTPKEWDVVSLLVRNAGRLVSHRQLLGEVWGPEYVKETEYLRVLLARVRRKLERDPSHPTHFITESGVGYRFEV